MLNNEKKLLLAMQEFAMPIMSVSEGGPPKQSWVNNLSNYEKNTCEETQIIFE